MARTIKEQAAGTAPGWTFLTNHSHVIICLSLDPEQRLRDVADRIGITERAVQKIVQDLVSEGILEKQRVGRRNQYRIRGSRYLRHPVEGHCRVADLIKMVNPDPRGLRAR
jgi:DNA-binding Lrp family transcriptional regulator